MKLSDRFLFTIQGDNYREDISIWSEDGENYYAFFPSSTGLSDVSLRLNTSSELFLNGLPLTEDYDLGTLELETAYPLSYSYGGAERTAQLTFLQSANVATMYIHTESGGMDQIHADKAHKENAGIILVDAEGHIDYAGGGSDKINGRGNSTWVSYSKKPYILKLQDASSMLGMNAAKKWVLLANAADVSNIRNKLVYDFAEKTNLYWTPDCEYVDLYLNGEYAGLYLLTEKIEISGACLDLSEDTYLFSFEPWTDENHFFTDAGRLIEITNPTDLTDQEVEDFRAYLQSVDNLILSGSSDLFEKIDLDSWVRKYLIEEIFVNGDGGLYSQYFYRDENFSDKIFSGPVWDYDFTLGRQYCLMIQNPACFYMSTQRTPFWDRSWYTALYHNEIFYQRLVEIYQSEYLSLLTDLVDHGINELSEKVERAAVNNNIRWTSLFAGGRTYQEDVQYIQEFLKERVDFLNSAWIDGIQYCTIQLDAQLYPPELDYLYYNVEPGKTVDSLPSPVELGTSDSEVWYIDGTDTAFDVTEPVTGDLFLRPRSVTELAAIAEAEAAAAEAARVQAEAEAAVATEAARIQAKAEEREVRNTIRLIVYLVALIVMLPALLFTAYWSRNRWGRWKGT